MTPPRTDTSPTRPLVPPLAITIGCALAQRAMPGTRPSRTSLALASPLLAAAGYLWLGGAGRFVARGTTVNPQAAQKASQLVTDGPHGISRNPMYLGMASALTSHAVARRSPLGLAWVALFVAAIQTRQIPYEEAHLVQAFGDDYERYRERVPRWL